RIDPELLYPVKHRSRQAQADLTVIRARAGPVNIHSLQRSAISLAYGMGSNRPAAFWFPRLHMRKRRFSCVIFCTLALGALCAAQEHHPEHTWGYGDAHGPSRWGDLTPEFATCKNGHHQSPIDIRNPKKAALTPIHFEYKPSPLHIVDNGHTIMVNYSAGSFISVGDKKYALKQFHFHRPSEEKINGKSFDMTVHLVHSDDEGNLAAVAVLLQKGEDSAVVHELWNALPKEKDKEEVLENVQINPSQILPADRGYYTFSGSLTTPPCSENVTWYVLKHPATVSAEEIERLSQLYRDDARPTQPLYDRIVLESQ
ncbi:MAG TPA: carbonic anhydrase family protein, partial [Terriglobales bacterium]|nr:carbonic anhydrase family protein [Terriglobales bacterium]